MILDNGIIKEPDIKSIIKEEAEVWTDEIFPNILPMALERIKDTNDIKLGDRKKISNRMLDIRVVAK